MVLSVVPWTAAGSRRPDEMLGRAVRPTAMRNLAILQPPSARSTGPLERRRRAGSGVRLSAGGVQGFCHSGRNPQNVRKPPSADPSPRNFPPARRPRHRHAGRSPHRQPRARRVCHRARRAHARAERLRGMVDHLRRARAGRLPRQLRHARHRDARSRALPRAGARVDRRGDVSAPRRARADDADLARHDRAAASQPGDAARGRDPDRDDAVRRCRRAWPAVPAARR